MLSAAAIVATAAYLYYYYTPEECSISRMLIAKRTPFHEFILHDSSQENKEKLARAWMDKYVRSVLLKKSVESKD